MKTSTAYNHYKGYLSAVKGVFRWTKLCQYTHKEHIENMGKVRADWKGRLDRCPRWVRGQADTIAGELFQDIQHNWVVWGFLFDGKVLSLNECSEEQRQQVFADKVKGEHYWLKEETPYHGKMWNRDGERFTKTFLLTTKTW